MKKQINISIIAVVLLAAVAPPAAHGQVAGRVQELGTPHVGSELRPLDHLSNFVPTPESRTSKECSHECGELVPMHGERIAPGCAGLSLYSVLFCPKCGTIWDRDVNAAKDIAYMFW